jgi:hypothetical protein
MTKIDLEFADIFPIEAAPHLLPEESEGEDALTKFLSDWRNGIDSEALDASLAVSHARIESHYAKLAATVTAPLADDELQKIARRLAPRIEVPTRIEEEISADGTRTRKTFNARTNDLVRVQILEPGEETE